MPAEEALPAVTDRRLLKWMFGFMRPVVRLALLACLFLSLWIGAEILTVRQTAEAINRIELVGVGREPAAETFWGWLRGQGHEAAGLERALLILALFSLAKAVLTWAREVTNARFSMQQVFHIREAVYDKLQRVGLRFHDRSSTGELINRALTDLHRVRAFIQSAVLLSLEIALIVGGYLALLLTRSPAATLLALAPVPVWVWYTIRFNRRVRPAQVAEMEAGDRNISLLTENLAGVHVVRAFAAEPYEIEKYARSCEQFLARVMQRIRFYANYAPVMRSISAVSHLALFLLAGYLIIRGRLHPGDILMLGSAMGAILGRLQQVAVINEQYQNAIVSARRLYEVLAARPEVVERPGARALPPGPGAVRFEHVTFGYDPARPVLHDVTFEVSGGQTVALVGPTGAGKSTLVQLLARFYDPQHGRILVDGVDVRDVTLESLRSQIAFVFQETYLFSDSIAANIAYSRPWEAAAEPRRREIEEVSRIAQVAEFIAALPQGYQTPLGERGMTLSGGQRQRLAIARALFANARILILDDATAAIDPETEELIHGGMRQARRGRTLFVIAHRLNTVKRADLVVVLERGRVAEIGTHEQLLRRGGHYRKVAAVQLFGVHEGQQDDARSAPAESSGAGNDGGAGRSVEKASVPARPALR